jgi:hypothetical protein
MCASGATGSPERQADDTRPASGPWDEPGREPPAPRPRRGRGGRAQVRALRLAGDFFFSNVQVKVWQGEVEGLATVFLEPNNGSFWVGCIYGRADDARRFGFFCGAALEYLRHHAPTRCRRPLPPHAPLPAPPLIQ